MDAERQEYITKRSNELIQQLGQAHSFFVLNPDISKYMDELSELQKECDHKMLNGECIYCHYRP